MPLCIADVSRSYVWDFKKKFMSNQPWEKWYWKDWLSDTELQGSAPSSRGIWVNILGRMWQKNASTLTVPAAQLCRLAGCSEAEISLFLEEAQALGFCYTSRQPNGDITLTSRRRQREEKARINNAQRQKRYYDNHKKSVSPNGTDPDPDPDPEEEKISEDRDLSSTTPKSAREDMPSEKVEKGPKTKQGIPDCPHQAIIDIYHEECPTMRKVRTWEGERPKHLKARWSQNPDLEWWRGYLAYCAQSGFLTGQVNHFSADLEWLIRPRNFQRVNEGKYHEQPVQPTRPQIEAAHLLPDGSPKVTH